MEKIKFSCSHCEAVKSSKQKLRTHVDKYHPETVTYDYYCQICNVGCINVKALLGHVTKVHSDVINAEDYYNQYILGNHKCFYCDAVLPYEGRHSGNFCNALHYNSYKRKDRNNYFCQICKTGLETKGALQNHLGKVHKDIDQEQYYCEYFLKDDDYKGNCLWCNKKVKFDSFTNGYNRFCYNTDCNVRWHNEYRNRSANAGKNISKTFKNDKSLLETNKEYWIKKGFSEEESQLKVTERQTTFSKEICIQKYGEEEGIKRWKERQDKWLNNYPKHNYSKISQELFTEIYKVIGDKYGTVYFAILNSEYKIKTKQTTRSLDFYIPKLKKAIEFMGDYWHGEARGNKIRDEEREKEILEADNEIKILNILEKEYNKNTIKKCLEFLIS